jgi:proline utilization trans-activator
VYSGLALRFSTSLGLHRRPVDGANLTPLELEHRVRLWWTTYIFDRSLTARLGQPLSIQDEDIDVEMPSADCLSGSEKEEIGVPAHLNANIELARIEGAIMRDIYGPSSATRGSFLHNVRTILNSLRKWDADVAPSLRWREGGSHRPVASLQLHFNQCIILTTRPVLLHILKTMNPFDDPNGGASTSSSGPHFETATILSESCISAARTSNSILSQLFVENALAIFGHFDAHYLFASTLVLIISAIISPNSGDSDAVQTAFHLLKTMRDSGNISASQFYSRLLHIQISVGRLREAATSRSDPVSADAPENNARAPTLMSSDLMPSGTLLFEDNDWGYSNIPDVNFANYDWTGLGRVMIDPLNNPMLQTFLDRADTTWDGYTSFTGEEFN